MKVRKNKMEYFLAFIIILSSLAVIFTAISITYNNKK
jgi:hypothetical protein